MVKPIEHDDLKEIFSWYRERGIPRPNVELLPPQGLWVPGVAAGYLIKTDAGIAFLEYFVTNPTADKRRRAVSLNQIADQFLASAKAQGIIAVFALTTHENIKNIAELKGFKRMPDKQIWGWRR